MKKYQLTVDESQARLIMRGLEALIRAGIKQYGHALEELTPNIFTFDYDEKNAIEQFIRKIEKLDMHPNASYGIHSDKVDDTYRVAYDMLQVVRNSIAWANAEDSEDERWKHGSKYMQVFYDHPSMTSKEKKSELIKCEVQDD